LLEVLVIPRLLDVQKYIEMGFEKQGRRAKEKFWDAPSHM
jgi:hypothetical protein